MMGYLAHQMDFVDKEWDGYGVRDGGATKIPIWHFRILESDTRWDCFTLTTSIMDGKEWERMGWVTYTRRRRLSLPALGMNEWDGTGCSYPWERWIDERSFE